MKLCLFLPVFASIIILASCGNATSENTTKTNEAENTIPPKEDYYFEYAIDGKLFRVNPDDILTSYNSYQEKTEFKIFAGTEGSPQLVLTIPHDMSNPSNTASGSPEPGNSISQGSVSLQDYPTKGNTFNSYDFMANPKQAPTPDAIVITASEKLGEEGRIITGTINVSTISGNDPTSKPYKITGKFKIKHLFQGAKF